MSQTAKHDLLRALPSVGGLLQSATATEWLAQHPRPLVTACLRDAVDQLRQAVQNDDRGRCGTAHVGEGYVLELAGALLAERVAPRIRRAINATGVILHTGLGRAVWPGRVVDDMINGLKGYVTLAIDRDSGTRSDRDGRVEPILTELTGAEAATVVNNNAGATLLVLAALAPGKEVIVSRGQLIEIGGAFRLPDVMAMSGARMVEVGTTNRTHPRDYADAVTENTGLLFRAHPSNFRVVGFHKEVTVADLVKIGHPRIPVVDDLGAGALVDLAAFGLPHEPTVPESLAAGADIVLFSADKLIGASQGGIIVGRKELIEHIRRHPLARALRPDKTCLMALERTLALFRDLDLLKREHPLYRMLATGDAALQARAQALAEAIAAAAPAVAAEVRRDVGYLGSGSLPHEALPTWVAALAAADRTADDLARRLRLDDACVFTRIDRERVILDARTIEEGDIPLIAQAVGRATA
ncbi:MAG: L-seryl-tRNA(Sec) selenium transferase [Planctomycetes bacterium]|nr:L-seryl-tRNA(Sec) selenium transferase [Planctomycetota bacterium]